MLTRREVLIIQNLQFKMTEEEILHIIHDKHLDYRLDNVSIFQKLPYPSSVVLDQKESRYEVYITGPQNEIRSPYWEFEDIDAAISFFLEKVSKDKEVAEQYEKLGVEWPPSPI